MASFPGQKSTGPALPNPVLQLTATVVNAGQVNLSWAAVSNASSYNVFRGGALIGSAVVTSLSDTTVAPATTYSYAVQAVNSNGVGVLSAPVSAITPPAQVTGLTAVPVSSSAINLAWTAVTGATSYKVFRGGVQIAAPTVASYPDTGLAASTQYTYTVAAVGAGGTGVQSAPVQATTNAAANQLRFNPGIYAQFDYASGASINRLTNGDLGIINGTASGNADNLTGVIAIFNWPTIDTGTGSVPVYDWSGPQAYGAAAGGGGTVKGVTYPGRQKHYWVYVSTYYLLPGLGSVTTGQHCVPTWLLNQHGAFATMGNLSALGEGTYPKYYNAPVANAIIAMLQNGISVFESDPFCEGFILNIGSAMKIANVVDNLGTRQSQINYDTDFTDAGQAAALTSFMQAFRSATSKLNFQIQTDYMFNNGDTNTSLWTNFYAAAIANKCTVGGPDSWTQSWIYPTTPYSVLGQNLTTRNNPSFNRGIASDQWLVGWKQNSPSTTTGYLGQVKVNKTLALTEQGGYIGQFSFTDILKTAGAALYGAHYITVEVNYSQTGNYNKNNGSPNTWWNQAGGAGNPGPSVYSQIQNAGAVANQVSPYP